MLEKHHLLLKYWAYSDGRKEDGFEVYQNRNSIFPNRPTSLKQERKRRGNSISSKMRRRMSLLSMWRVPEDNGSEGSEGGIILSIPFKEVLRETQQSHKKTRSDDPPIHS